MNHKFFGAGGWLTKTGSQPRPPEKDQLFRNDYDHCRLCTAENLVQRGLRVQRDPVVHYSRIGSANRVMRDAATRERLRQEKGVARGLVHAQDCNKLNLEFLAAS